jgi:myo-inositol-1(or 4)-monophosphatase
VSALIGTGFSYRAAQRARQAERLARLLPLVADIRRGGSAALELCRVADGSIDAFYEDDLERWDWVAGALIVEEAGGVVEPLASEAGGGGVAASAAMLPELRRVLDLDQRAAIPKLRQNPVVE